MMNTMTFRKKSKNIVFIISLFCLIGAQGRKVWCQNQTNEVSFSKAQSLWLQGNWDEAVLAYETYLKKEPRGIYASQAYMNLGYYLESFDRLDEALLYYQKGLNEAGGRMAEEFETEIAAIHGRLGNYDRAIRIYQRLMEETDRWDIFKISNRYLKSIWRLKTEKQLYARRFDRCGEESLKEIFCQLKINEQQDLLEKYLEGSKGKGISLDSLRQAALAHGLKSFGVKVGEKNPELIQAPAILLCYPSHYVVFLGVQEKGIKVYDSAYPNYERVISPEIFKKWWSGFGLCFASTQINNKSVTLLSQKEMSSISGGDHAFHEGWAYNIGKKIHSFFDDPPDILVNTGTLNILIEDMDGRWKNRGPNIILKRTYNSDDSGTGMFGNSWHFQYEVYLTEHPGNTVTLTRGDGAWNIFESQGDGNYVSKDGAIFDQLKKKKDGTYSLLIKDTKETYFFDPVGRLNRISDRNGNTITFQYKARNIPVIWGSEGSKRTQFDGPNAIAVYKNKFVYVADARNNRIQKLSNKGEFISRWGNYGTRNKQFDYPMGIAVDNQGFVYVADTYNHRIQKFNSKGKFITKWGRRGSRDGEFNYPEGMTIDQNGYLYVTDYQNHRIQKFTTTGKFVTKWGRIGSGKGQFRKPRSVAVDSKGYVYVTDRDNHRVQKFDSSGAFITAWGGFGFNNRQFNEPFGIAVDTQDYVYVADSENERIQMFDKKGKFITSWGKFGIGAGQFWRPTGVTVDESGDVYVCDYYNDRIQKFKSSLPFGVFLSSITDSHGRAIDFAYGANGKVESLTDPLDRTASFIYDSKGNLEKTTDMEGNTTVYTYDKNNYIRSVKTPSGKSQIIYKFLGEGLVYMPDTIVDPNGNDRKYSLNGYTVTVKDAKGNRTRYTTDDRCYISKVVNANGGETSFTYDNPGNLISVTDPNGNTTSATGNALGNITSLNDAEGNKIRCSYNKRSNLTKLIDPSGNKYTYSYDTNDNLININNPRKGKINFFYDSFGQLTGLKDARGNITHFAYDNLGNLTKQTDPLGHITSYSYDQAGRLTSLTDANGNTIGVSYDNLDRITQINYPDGIVKYAYEDWNLKTVSNKDGRKTIYDYDKMDRLVSVTDVNGKTIRYGYDSIGNRTSITYPGGKSVKYTYDKIFQLVQVTDWLKQKTIYRYDPGGNLLSVRYPNGTATYNSYDNANRLISLTNKESDASIISSYTYTLDALGNKITTTTQEPLTPLFTKTNINYSYDNDNQLINANGTEYQYDSNGNLTGKTQGSETTSFTYDFENRLTDLSSGTESSAYEYDDLGSRLEKRVNSVVTGYVNDINRVLPQVIAETDNSGKIENYYVYGLGLISKITPKRRSYFYHYDGLGSTIAISDSSGKVVNKYAYDPFGKVLTSQEKIQNSFKYVGRYGVMDDENGLMYMRARYYDPEVGRFITKDPIGWAEELNLYTYVGGNPISSVDPSGLLGATIREWAYTNREIIAKVIHALGTGVEWAPYYAPVIGWALLRSPHPLAWFIGGVLINWGITAQAAYPGVPGLSDALKEWSEQIKYW